MIGNGLCHAIFMFVMHNNYICDWLWENPPVTHKDDYLEKRN